MGPNAISWSSKKQPTAIKSSSEVGYRTIATTTTELLLVTELLKELGHSIVKMPILFSDNIRAIYLCANPVFHARTKHLVIDYHFAHDLVVFKKLQVSHVSISHQLVDQPIKLLSHSRHAFVLNKIDVRSPFSVLQRRVDSLSINQKQSSAARMS